MYKPHTIEQYIKSIAFWKKTLRWSISCSLLCHASD